MYLDGAVLSQEWDIHRTTESGELYETTVRLPNYPLNITYKITYTQVNENEAFLKRVETLLEPMLLLFLGIIIGGLIIGMYLPIFQMGKTI